jgi:hypothetical protein
MNIKSVGGVHSPSIAPLERSEHHYWTEIPKMTVEVYQHAITGFLHTEHLQGGAGELPVFGLMSLHVNEGDVVAAQQVLQRFERGELSLYAKKHF